MIRTSRCADGRVVLHLEEEASAAFVDVDWIPADAGPVRAPYVSSSGDIWYRERRLLGESADPAARVAGWISALADEIVRLAGGVAGDRVQVTGQGVTAEQVRRRLEVAETAGSAKPQTIIEMTGKPAQLRKATEDVADGGLIIIGGESDPPFEINLYRDVHRRGLHILGAGYLGATPSPSLGDGGDLPEPVAVRTGEPLPSGLWYRVAR